MDVAKMKYTRQYLIFEAEHHEKRETFPNQWEILAQ